MINKIVVKAKLRAEVQKSAIVFSGLFWDFVKIIRIKWLIWL